MSKKLLCLVTLLSAVCLGCSGASRITSPEIDASAAAKAAMTQYDTNQDGKIADEELAACAALASAIEKLDTNKDKAISAEEIAARIEQWNTSGVGLALTQCNLSFNGQPLQGAKVVFEPEPFMNSSITPGEGTADQAGFVLIKQPDAELPGMPLGFYKVKVTSDSVEISEIYNTDTPLGVEVGLEAGGPVSFNLN